LTIYLSGDECFKSASQLTDTLLDPTSEQNPLTRALDLKEPMFTWLTRPENVYRGNRFGVAMRGMAGMEPRDLIFEGTSCLTAASRDFLIGSE
jgi:hypothetical protein